MVGGGGSAMISSSLILSSLSLGLDVHPSTKKEQIRIKVSNNKVLSIIISPPLLSVIILKLQQ